MNEHATQEQVAQLAKMVEEANGQLIAMGIAIRSLVLTHPDREYALSVLTSELLRWETSGLYRETPDTSLKGFGRAKKLILPTDGDLLRAP